MHISHTQKGRSLLEMLAVISLIGLLVIGGTTGLRWALARIQAIRLIKEVSTRAVLIETSAIFEATPSNHTFSLPGFTNGRYVFVQRKLGPKAFMIRVDQISQSVCEQIEHMASGSTADHLYINCPNAGAFNGCHSPLEEAESLCQANTNNSLTVIYGDGTVNVDDEGDGGFVPAHDPCPQSTEIPCGKLENYVHNGEQCTRWVADCQAPGHCVSPNNICVCPRGMRWSSADQNCVNNEDCPGGYWDGANCQTCITDDHCLDGQYCENNTCVACTVGDICGSCQMKTPQEPYWDGSMCACQTSETCHEYGYGECGGKCEEFCNTEKCSINEDCCAGYFCNVDKNNNSCAVSTTGRCQRIDMTYSNGWACSKKAMYSLKDAENICAALQGHLVNVSEVEANRDAVRAACRDLNAKIWTSTAFGGEDGKKCWNATYTMNQDRPGTDVRNSESYRAVCTGSGMWSCAKDDDCTSPTNAVCQNGTCVCPSNSYLQDGTCIVCDTAQHMVVNGDQNGCTCGSGYNPVVKDEQTTCCPVACSTAADCCEGNECVAGACVAATWQCNNLCTGGKYCRVNDSPAGDVEGACGVTDITYTCTTGGVGSFYEGFALTNGNNHSWWDAWNRCNAAGLRLATVAEATQYQTYVSYLTRNIYYYWLADESGCQARYGLRGNVGGLMRKTWGNSANANGDGNRLHGLCIKDPTEQCTGNQAYAHDMTCRDCPEGATPSEDRRTCICGRGEGTFDKTNNKCVYTDCEDGYKFDEETSACVPDWKCNSLCDTSYQYCKVGNTPTGGDLTICPIPGSAVPTCTNRLSGSVRISNGLYAWESAQSWYDAWNFCDSMGAHIPTREEFQAHKADFIAIASRYHWINETENTSARPCYSKHATYNSNGSLGVLTGSKSKTDTYIICLKNDIKDCGTTQVHTNEGDCQSCPDNATKDPEGDSCICANGETWDRSTNQCLITECPPGKTLYGGKYCLTDPWKCNELCPSGYFCRGHQAQSTNTAVCPDGSALDVKCIKLPTPLKPYKGIYPVRPNFAISWYDAWNMCDALGMAMLPQHNGIIYTERATVGPYWGMNGNQLWTGNDTEITTSCQARAASISAAGAWSANRYGKLQSGVYGAFCYKSGSDCRDNQVVDNAGNCVTCPADARKSGSTCLCDILGLGTYDATTNTCTYAGDCMPGITHLEDGKCVCNEGYAFDTQAQQCVETNCTTPDECGCAANQYMASNFQCVNCSAGYEPDETRTKQVKCSDVSKVCASCKAANASKPYWNDQEQICQSCMAHQYRSGGSCKKCPLGQRANEDGSACVACTANNESRTAECASCAYAIPSRPYWNSFLNKCTFCTQKNQIEEGGNCHACPTGMSLQSNGECQCDNGIYNDVLHRCCPTTCSTTADCCTEEGMFCNAGTCSICTGNKILHEGSCVACPSGATAIKNATECQCPAGSVWNATNLTCDACPANSYSENNTCVACEMGTYLEDNKCKTCTKTNAAMCENKACTTQDHCGGKGSQYYCRYTSPGASNPGSGTCKPVGGSKTDHLPSGRRLYFSDLTNLDMWSGQNWCIAIGRQAYTCHDLVNAPGGNQCATSARGQGVEVNKTCRDFIGYVGFSPRVYLQEYGKTSAGYTMTYYTGYTSSNMTVEGAVCGGWARNQNKMAVCE